MASRLELFEKAFLPGVEIPSPTVALSSLTGSAAAFAALALARHPFSYPSALVPRSLGASGPSPFVLVVTPGLPEADILANDLRILARESGVRVLDFPPVLENDPEAAGARLRAAAALAAYPGSDPSAGAYPFVLVASLPALVKPVPAAAAVAAGTVHLETGTVVGFDATVKKLVDGGYVRTPEVEAPGQFSVRGGVLDAWAPGEEKPFRAEFFGDDLESLRVFDAATQNSVSKLEAADVPPVTVSATGGKNLLAVLPPGATVLWLEWNAYDAQILPLPVPPGRREGPHPAPFFRQIFTGDPAPCGVPAGSFESSPLPGLAELGADVARHPELLESARAKLKAHLDAAAARGALVVRDDELSDGFEVPGLAVVTRSDTVFAARRHVTRSAGASAVGARLDETMDLEPGELVVHVDYGIGRFLGSTEVEVDGQRSEVFTIEYADGAKLHVPVAHAHLLSRYIGVKGERVTLHRLDGKRWLHEKAEAQRAVADLAASLLETQARRAVVPGYAYDPNPPGLEAFEAAFPYQETPDQARAIAEVTKDLAASKPMDRLICGDAGYGKTEVAMRAAFIAAMNGRQVAVLAPTTVLAEQHFETFSARFEGTPIRIEAVSRFQTPESRKGTFARLAAGSVDIVVGTHALLGPQVRFHDLGLVVIDEEQRFGVKHKEFLKRLRATADILTMSATPIPRTLYLSMTGARDLSLLRTPPRERVAVETKIVRDTDATVVGAIRHELARGGQVYYLYNRVLTIGRLERRLHALVPEARIAVAHGQLGSAELAEKMRRFEKGEVDVLLSTTIVENGLDIPRANTILVDRADRFGIADLYQLRGRVGRAARQGYAYFLLPTEGSIDSDARERLSALRKHAGLGAGFNLALRDLEIRGAGNLLGSEQSGHIAAVGFGLYCQLLQRTIAHMKGEKVPLLVDVTLDFDFLDLSPGDADPGRGACLPYDYVEDEAQRMGFHKRLAEASDVTSVRKLRGELADRYGRLPTSALRLVRLAEFRVMCAEAGVIRVEVRGTKAVFYKDGSRTPAYVGHTKGVTAERKIASLFDLLAEAKNEE